MGEDPGGGARPGVWRGNPPGGSHYSAGILEPFAGHYIPPALIRGLSCINRPSCPANTIHRNNVVLMLEQRWRRWDNVKTTLFQYIVFAGRPVRGVSKRWNRGGWRRGEVWIVPFMSAVNVQNLSIVQNLLNNISLVCTNMMVRVFWTF